MNLFQLDLQTGRESRKKGGVDKVEGPGACCGLELEDAVAPGIERSWAWTESYFFKRLQGIALLEPQNYWNLFRLSNSSFQLHRRTDDNPLIHSLNSQVDHLEPKETKN